MDNIDTSASSLFVKNDFWAFTAMRVADGC